jgi:hypothetical protein
VSAGLLAIPVVATAVYGRLAADTAIAAAAPGGITDYAPDQPTLPYIRLGGWREAPDIETLGKQGRTVSFSAHVFSDYRGTKQCLSVLALIIASLRWTALTVTGWQAMPVEYTGTEESESELVDGVEVHIFQASFAVRVYE